MSAVHARILGWAEALVLFAEAERGRSFEWGETDCVSLALRAFGRVYGVDLHSGVIVWRDRESAQAAAAVFDPSTWLRAHGAEIARPSFARPGDVLIGKADRMPAVHLVLDHRALTSAPGEPVGLIRIARLQAAHDLICWRMP